MSGESLSAASGVSRANYVKDVAQSQIQAVLVSRMSKTEMTSPTTFTVSPVNIGTTIEGHKGLLRTTLERGVINQDRLQDSENSFRNTAEATVKSTFTYNEQGQVTIVKAVATSKATNIESSDHSHVSEPEISTSIVNENIQVREIIRLRPAISPEKAGKIQAEISDLGKKLESLQERIQKATFDREKASKDILVLKQEGGKLGIKNTDYTPSKLNTLKENLKRYEGALDQAKSANDEAKVQRYSNEVEKLKLQIDNLDKCINLIKMIPDIDKFKKECSIEVESIKRKVSDLNEMIDTGIHQAADNPDALNVGQNRFAIATQDTPLLKTIGLGPCVCVTLFDPETHTGLLCHIDTHNGIDDSINKMKEEFAKNGGDPDKCIVSMIGGQKGSSEEIIKGINKNFKQVVNNIDTLGTVARDVIFSVDTGETAVIHKSTLIRADQSRPATNEHSISIYGKA